MDTSGTYIKMCEKAEEIQKPIELDKHDFIYVKSVESNAFAPMVGKVTNADGFGVIEEFIWLPRQDQLQEMVEYDLEAKLECFTDFYFEYGESDHPVNSYASQFASMEQLWLAFVIKERYSKVWDGEDWVYHKIAEG